MKIVVFNSLDDQSDQKQRWRIDEKLRKKKNSLTCRVFDNTTIIRESMAKLFAILLILISISSAISYNFQDRLVSILGRLIFYRITRCFSTRFLV